jgi:predicted rRNA methylase YqxC with S4 and FtsJ domains
VELLDGGEDCKSLFSCYKGRLVILGGQKDKAWEFNVGCFKEVQVLIMFCDLSFISNKVLPMLWNAGNKVSATMPVTKKEFVSNSNFIPRKKGCCCKILNIINLLHVVFQ